MIPRYQNERITKIWGAEATYARWFRIEVVHLREIAGADVAEQLEKVGPPTTTAVTRWEEITGHDVAAFLRALDDQIVDELGTNEAAQIRSQLHYGLTSSDLVDTGMALAIAESHDVVMRSGNQLQRTLDDLANRIQGRRTIGRTHGQLACPMPAEHRWEVLSEMLERTLGRANTAFAWNDVGKLSGPVGIREDGFHLVELGLRNTASTQLVPRDRLAWLAHALAELATVGEAIATQVWLLAQSGIDEMRVARVGSVGSSAMPHKINPIMAENVRGLARLARVNAETLQLGIVQWGEHDLAHSSVERVALPDLLHLVCTIMSRTAALVSGSVWEQPTTPEGYVDTHEQLLALQADGTPYVDAHNLLTLSYRDGKIPATTTTEETD